MDTSLQSYWRLVQEAKLRLLQMHFDAGVGHIGGNLSALDALLCLHHRVMHSDDVFVLSKGHAAGALYITLWSLGQLGDHQLRGFHADGSKLCGHPAPGGIVGIPVATGSLGHGLPMAVGIALAKRLKGEPGRVFCLTSDGEWQEGSNWEALIFAHHHRLDNLTVLVDSNALQGFGSTQEVASMDPLQSRIEAFGVEVQELDGHDLRSLEEGLGFEGSAFSVLILRTIKGKGVSFMEGKMEWHYLPLTHELYSLAADEIQSR